MRRIAIYHLEAKVISRGAGRSAVAAAAYMSCSQIYNDYDGVPHDYTRKQGLVWQRVFLPDMAPREWQDRSVLWNAVEEAEKTKDSRLAREFVAALPVELEKDAWTALLAEFIQTQFVAEGMCADAAIHDTDGHNPHAHILLTVRPLHADGTWQKKTEKEYLCVRDGEERGFTAAEFKAAQTEGWEKQYQYRAGRKKVYMAPSAAEAQGLERLSKNPKSTRYGRQNPISGRWNSEEQLVLWREAWADTVNRHLERFCIDARIDHRSHADRGLDEQPTVHEGVVARAMEKQGILADRCELNRQIKADNALLRELKAGFRKLMESVKNTVPALADAMEDLRCGMLLLRYRLSRIHAGKENRTQYLSAVKAGREQYLSLSAKIRARSKERKGLLAEKKETPKIHFVRQRELTQRISELTEELEELRSEKSRLLVNMRYAGDDGKAAFDRDISAMEAGLKRLEAQEEKHSAQLETALSEYAALREQAADFDPVELYEARQAIRPEKERMAQEQLRKAGGGRFSPSAWLAAKERVYKQLGEDNERYQVRRIQQEQQKHRPRGRDFER